MKTKFNRFLILLLVFMVQFAFAQEKTISGIVSDGLGPVSDITVRVKGTDIGTATDFDGKYSIQAKTGDVLLFTHVSYNETEKLVGSANTINVSLTETGNVLDIVVITAQGIKKEKKALGYAVSSIGEEQVKNNAESDINRVLAGKTAGVNITSANGLSGSSNKVIIRGMGTFAGGNNALYIIDGIPFSNDTNESGDVHAGQNGSSRSFDIDPNNIAKIEVLKGLAAATLYGSEGRNGVILITTKNSSKKGTTDKLEIEVNSSMFINKVASLADYQDTYGGGFNQQFGWFYSNWGPNFDRDAIGGWANQIGDGAVQFHEDGTLHHPVGVSGVLDPTLIAQYADERYEYKPRNSVEDFFRTGVTTSNSLSLRSATEKGGMGLTISHLDDKGFTPGNEVTRTNFGISAHTKLSNKFSINTSLNYVNTDFKTPPIALSGGSSSPGGTSIFGDLFYTPRSIDITELPFESPIDGSSIYYRTDNAIQHPLWTLKNAVFSQNTNRLFGNASVAYDLTEKVNVMYRATVDTYNEANVNSQNKGGASGTNRSKSGVYETWDNKNVIFDHTLLLNGNGYSFLNDKLNFSYNIGGTTRSTTYDRIGLNSEAQDIFGFLDHSNFTTSNQVEFHSKVNVAGLFGQVSFDYGDMLFLNIAGRNDWVSNFKNNSLFYPSVSLSFLPTKAFEGIKSDKGINYLKLRVGIGSSANFDPGTTYPVPTLVNIDNQVWVDGDGNTVVGHSTALSSGNPDLNPELVSELEFGVEGKLFKKRVSFDFSVWNRETTDLMVRQPIPASQGSTSTITNIGLIEANGIELDLGIDIIKNENRDGFRWNSSVNFSKNESLVKDLGQNTKFISFGNLYSNLTNGARPGYPITAIYGQRINRNDDGEYLVNGVGRYTFQAEDEDGLLPFIGDANPDFVMNYTNSFSYKGITLNVSVNHTSGGDIYSQTIAALLGRGLTTDTLDRLDTFILPGVSSDTGLPNQIQINNSDFYFGNLFANNIHELQIYDASVVRLQEVSLSYSLPKRLLKDTPFGKINFKFSGNNLWYNAYNTPEGMNFDPNVAGLGAGNGVGFEFLTGPSAKRYGLSLNLTF